MTPGARVSSSTTGSHIIGRHVPGSAAAKTSPSLGIHAQCGAATPTPDPPPIGGSGVPCRVWWLTFGVWWRASVCPACGVPWRVT